MAKKSSDQMLKLERATRLSYVGKQKIIGIDPGKNGGIAVYAIGSRSIIDVTPMPDSPQDMYGFLEPYRHNSICYLEKVGPRPGQGGKAMFTFGQGFGWLEMALLALKIPTHEVPPQKWQKELGTGNKAGKTDTEWKKHLKTIAQQIHPNVADEFNIRLQSDWLRIADALLIVEYGRIIENKQ